MQNNRAIWLKKQDKSNILLEDGLSAARFSKLRMRSFLKPISHLYPDFETWLNFTFVRQMGEGKRKVVVAHDGNNVYGCSLLKITPEENKICTFYVHPDAREQNLADDLMRHSLAHFDDKPIISVSEERTKELQPLLKKHGFEIFASIADMYRPDRNENFFVSN